MNNKLGCTGTDAITGFTGVATGYVEYITGCNQFLLTPKVDEKGKPEDGRWFDEQRVRFDGSLSRIELNNGTTPGADMPAPVR